MSGVPNWRLGWSLWEGDDIRMMVEVMAEVVISASCWLRKKNYFIEVRESEGGAATVPSMVEVSWWLC